MPSSPYSIFFLYDKIRVSKLLLQTAVLLHTLPDQYLGESMSFNHIYRAYGSFEGMLHAVFSSAGFRFFLHRTLIQEPLPCFFKKELFPLALQVTNKHISVFGMVRYTSNQEPLWIIVRGLDVFPDEKDLSPLA